MILRSVTKHVKDQNWFAVLLDLLIVVFGVFIGIQVANWNQELVGERQSKVLIQRLIGDLKLDLEVVDHLLNYQQIVKSYAETAIDGFNEVETVVDEQFVISAYQASQVNLPTSYRGTFTEMINTGTINLVKNNQIKTKIMSYYSDDWANRPNMVYLAPYREQIRRAIPHVIQEDIRVHCGDHSVQIRQIKQTILHSTCNLSMDNELFLTAAKILRNNPDLLLDLQYQIAVYSTQVLNMSDTKIKIEELINSLETISSKTQ